MSWLIYALICTLGWGSADLFYKKASGEEDRNSHLRQAVWVGLVMGAASFALLIFSGSRLTAKELFRDAVTYAPVSLCYIVSMVIGYAGLRYLELSIVSPVQNASGALAMVCMAVWFLLRGRIGSLFEEYSWIELGGTALIVAGVMALAVAEKRISDREAGGGAASGGERRYRAGALALMFPFLYCVFDTVGTAADGIILNEETGLGLGELDVLILYGLTFFLAGAACFLVIRVKEKKWYSPFGRGELPRALAAVFEEFGQVFYVFAMAENPVLAAPLVASYCIVSVIFSRVFLGERLRRSQSSCICLVILGIVLLGVAEGLS